MEQARKSKEPSTSQKSTQVLLTMSKPLVSVTGATGHLGFRSLVITLQAGYQARVALRKPEQSEKILATASVKSYAKDVEFVTVPDITADNAYDHVLEGVEYILHIASPIPAKMDSLSGT